MYYSLCCKDQSSLSSNRSANMDSPASSKNRGTALHQGCAALQRHEKCDALHQTQATLLDSMPLLLSIKHVWPCSASWVCCSGPATANKHVWHSILSIVVLHQESGLVKCSQPGIKVSTYHSASVSCTLSWIGVVIICGTIDMSWRMSAWVSHNIFSTISGDKIQQVVVLQQKTCLAVSTEVYNTTILLWYSQAVTASICSLSHVLSLS